MTWSRPGLAATGINTSVVQQAVWQNLSHRNGWTHGTIGETHRTGDDVVTRSASREATRAVPTVHHIPVARIRPEDGLDRKRDREGHRDLQRSIEQFGVLTPITVRKAPDRSGDFLLIKGQGRTLACRLLGIETIPAIVLDKKYAESEKVQQFLVENVARLKMRPIDRALLIFRAREEGEETATIAKRFGLSPATVRRLLAQMNEATSAEVATLRSGQVSLAVHSVVSRNVAPADRPKVLELLAGTSLKAKELEELFIALGWGALETLGHRHRSQRIRLLEWACGTLDRIATGPIKDRIRQLALDLPAEFDHRGATSVRAAR